jgi:hypothetical protein
MIDAICLLVTGLSVLSSPGSKFHPDLMPRLRSTRWQRCAHCVGSEIGEIVIPSEKIKYITT